MKLDHLKEYPVVLSQDVIWGDMDAFGHINNTVVKNTTPLLPKERA